ncbi:MULTISPECIES: AraC family transcriptional regulator [Clostridium]|jgi:AraC-like DNA-binding protein|uniref:AraC family transcriptional regulator n=1 Tax=Candidatus Clostridium helianthi TaxID=3381660 RepID=A0ABW8S8A4_9CLOT|nr:AraC family transcriptional regulator [Clostridium beijerinckii]NOW06080.1 AraC-like DNA-binding protein [Clostridium beijerinckii]NYC00776.1 AraC-like DNA-binding protein [Clostridium beijerinckii]
MAFVFSNNNDYSNIELNLYTCGIESCESEHSYGPAVRSGYMIHYVLDGKGTYKVNGKTYNLEKNQGFLIEPNVLIYYKADRAFPWKYTWIGFNGIKAKDYLKRTTLSSDNPIFSFPENSNLLNSLSNIVDSSKTTSNRNLIILSKLYEFLYLLCENFPNHEVITTDRPINYIEEALFFIHQNYADKIAIKDIAAHICIDRSYLHRIFKNFTNKSPQEYLLSLRMEKAASLLQNTELRISDVSRSVGYSDPLLFSKTFKKSKGLSPSDFRYKCSNLE